MEKVFEISIILVFVFGIVVLILRLSIEKHLALKQPALWEKLGRPSIIKIGSRLEENNGFVSFFSNKEHLELNDLVLNRLAFATNATSKITLVFLSIVVFSGVFLWMVPHVFSM